MERDEEVKKVREEMLKNQKDCEEQLLAEMTAAQELQEKLDRARDRKEELKQQLSEAEDRGERAEKAHRYRKPSNIRIQTWVKVNIIRFITSCKGQ